MKRLITLLMLACMMTLPAVVGLVQYTGTPQLPYLVYGHVEWNEQMLAGTRLQITNEATGYTTTITTDANGYWQQDAQNWQTTASGRPPVMYGDLVKVKAIDGCGTNDVCEKQFEAYMNDEANYAVVNLAITGDIVCPPVVAPTCSPCHGGGGGGVYDCSEDKCEELFPPEECQACEVCPAKEVCPDEKVCPSPVICPVDKECTVEECKDTVCPDVPEEGSLVAIIAAIVAFFVGAGGALGYKKLEKDGKILNK